MGFLDSLLNIAGNVANELLELQQQKLQEDMEKKEQEEMEATLEFFFGVRNRLKGFLDVADDILKSAKETYITDNKEQMYEETMRIAYFAYSLGNEKLLRENWEVNEDMDRVVKDWEYVAKGTDETFECGEEQDGYQFYKSHLKNDARKFAFQIENILDDLENEEIGYLLKKAINCMSEFREALKINMKNWNNLIEVGYSELNDV